MLATETKCLEWQWQRNSESSDERKSRNLSIHPHQELREPLVYILHSWLESRRMEFLPAVCHICYLVKIQAGTGDLCFDLIQAGSQQVGPIEQQFSTFVIRLRQHFASFSSVFLTFAREGNSFVRIRGFILP